MAVLGKRLKEAREKKKLTQIEASKLLGISNGTLSGYERNYRDPDTQILEKMANLYGVSTDFLLGRPNDINIQNENDKDEQDFLDFINDPDLQRWYKELPKSNEDDLRKLRKMWEIIKSEED